MSSVPDNGAALRVRLETLEHRVTHIEQSEPAVMVERIRALASDLDEISAEIRAVKRALYTFAFSVAGAAIVFAIGVLQMVSQ